MKLYLTLCFYQYELLLNLYLDFVILKQKQVTKNQFYCYLKLKYCKDKASLFYFTYFKKPIPYKNFLKLLLFLYLNCKYPNSSFLLKNISLKHFYQEISQQLKHEVNFYQILEHYIILYNVQKHRLQ